MTKYPHQQKDKLFDDLLVNCSNHIIHHYLKKLRNVLVFHHLILSWVLLVEVATALYGSH